VEDSLKVGTPKTIINEKMQEKFLRSYRRIGLHESIWFNIWRIKLRYQRRQCSE
jgi:hypothetical protein